MYSPKNCKICGDLFIPRSSKQLYCKKAIVLKCSVCGSYYEGLCQPNNATTCNDTNCKKHAGYVKQIAKLGKRICKICGDEFQPTAANQQTCNKPIKKICAVCGKQFDDICALQHETKTCSELCKKELQNQNKKAHWGKLTKLCRWCGKEFHPTTNSQVYCDGPHYKKCRICGKEFEIDASSIDSRARVTCSKQCQNIISGEILQKSEVRAKQKATMLDRYGAEYPAQIPQFSQKQTQTMINRYGVISPMQHPDMRGKISKNAKTSKLEQRICNLLDNYAIKYIHHYFIKNDKYSHEFDFYLPDFNLLLDADGVYYHSYLDDPDGERVRDDYDEVRLALVPEHCRLHVIVEGNEDVQIKEVIQKLESTGHDFAQYDSQLFQWCRSIDFPYPSYDDKRLMKDWGSLNKYINDTYVPQCRIGESIIKQFHKSIYHCHVGTCLSPYEGWYDDDKLKKVIRNRLIYQNSVDPSKILSGFNISKTAPRVTVFNPILAKYLIRRYLNDYSQIFDPFSGFSGRLLGAASLGKQYIGQDINSTTIKEANKIIRYLELDSERYSVSAKDVLKSAGKYECLLTCPPYSSKEVYGSETVFKTCDEWIDECLSRFKCKTYVFVVDDTDNYADNVVEELSNKSHFADMHEKVIVIHKEGNE